MLAGEECSNPRTPEWIIGQIAKLLKGKGLGPSQVDSYPALLVDIMRPPDVHHDETPQQRKEWLRGVIEGWLRELATELSYGTSEYELELTANTVLTLFGFIGVYRSKPLKKRREDAAEVYGVKPRTIEASWQVQYASKLGWQLYRSLPRS